MRAPSLLAPVGPIPWLVFSKSFTVWYQFTLANNLLIGRPCCTLRLAYNFSNTKLNKKGGTTLSMSFGLGQLTLVRRASGGGQRSWKMLYCYISLIFNVMLPNIRWATSGKKLRGGFQVMKIWKTYLISADHLHLKKSFVRTGKTRSQTMLMVPKIALTSRSSLASIGTNSRSSGKETNTKERGKKQLQVERQKLQCSQVCSLWENLMVVGILGAITRRQIDQGFSGDLNKILAIDIRWSDFSRVHAKLSRKRWIICCTTVPRKR